MPLFRARRSLQLAALVLGLSSVAACGGSALSGSEEGDTDGPIKIGIVAPLSGPSASFGSEFPIGAEYAKEWIEQEGLLGDREIELHMIDDQSAPDAAVAAVRELTDDGVNIFVGTVNSPVALALAPVMEQTDSVLITTAAHAMEITHENFSENVFRATDNPYVRHVAQAQLAAEEYPDIKQWSLVGPDHAYGVSTLRSFKAGLNKHVDGAVVDAAVMTAFGAADYRQSMSKVQSQEPEGVFSSEYAADAVTAYSQALEMGLWDDAVLMDASNGFLTARALKENTPEHWTADHWYPGAYDNEMTKFIVERYTKEKDGLEPTGFVGSSFTGVVLVAEAIAAADGSSGTDDLIKALEGIEIETPTGQLEMRAEDHQAIKDVNFFKLKGCADCEFGYEVTDFKVIPSADLMEPATPGKAVEYGPGSEL